MFNGLIFYDPFGYVISPISFAFIGLATSLYLRGLKTTARFVGKITIWRRALFFAGLAIVLVATNAPLAHLGHSQFSAHQVEHLLLRLVGPLVIAVSQPWHILKAGSSRQWRKSLRKLGGGHIARFMTRPGIATACLVGSLFIWQVPQLFALAQKIALLEILAHLSMTLAGLWYFSMMFDHRDPPEGARRGARLISGFVVIVSNIFLGSLTTFKEVTLYVLRSSPYHSGRLGSLVDETVGGYMIWIPSSMVLIVAIILVMNGWNAAEERRWNSRGDLMRNSNSAALEFPETAAELRLKVNGPNRDMGRTLALCAFAMFTIVMATVVTIVYAF